MARNLGPSCRLCRREGIKLMLKATRCETAKCAMEKQTRNKPPGVHSWRKGRASEYGIRLREKQKVKRYYGILERQFRSCFKQAERKPGNTGEALLCLLERRLDNVIYKMRFALSRSQARQIIAQGHVKVNNHKVDIASYIVRAGDKITLKAGEKTLKMVKASLELDPNAPLQDWLHVDPAVPKGRSFRCPIEIMSRSRWKIS